ncbi:GAF and ANTAR domain-containing protein [Streptomyces minutiscleroticus]|uniref:GAF domain-containing protein n=1 Tax=Streptomyces minutiscleroticus TaxID=68238 RepID=A0A918U5P8_9ACTN|nr:GAF and ANTAR domain-containing protein [Streptomyces minutiscleroticus]GGX96898.1 GAF domain-containing protein [Streptomyces minutiscleroticus]
MTGHRRQERIGPLMRSVLRGASGVRTLAAVPAEDCAAALGLSGVTVSTLASDGSAELLWYARADRLGIALEDLQYTLGEGPTPDVAVQGRPVLEGDIARMPPSRWPLFLPDALHTGAAAVFALPLRIGAILYGVFTGYRTASGPLTAQQLRGALAFTDLTVLLLDHRAGAPYLPESAADLDTLHRAEVHQATGLLSARLDIPLDHALVRLRAYAYCHTQPLLEVARDVIHRHSRLDEDTSA